MSVAPGSVAGMKYGLDISPVGDGERPDRIAELAALAENHGWTTCLRGLPCVPRGLATYDVWVTLGLVAQATTRVTIGTMVTPRGGRGLVA
jgi:alkanesulfonate monooxygenase SsuD/methylene tetrahydromethanopterin reductase-like flavin-dependent oxidoreductase (luciferase family)